MSEMQANKGIIKEVGHGKPLEETYQKLVADGEIEDKWTERDLNGNIRYIDSDKYTIVDGRMFDVSDAPDDTDAYEEREIVEKVSDTEYKVDLYYYNGACNMSELLDKGIPAADKAYAKKKSEWKDATGVRIRIVLSKYDDESVKYTYEGDLKWLLNDDDGGFYGYEQAKCDAAEAVDGDHMKYEDWQVETVEYKGK